MAMPGAAANPFSTRAAVGRDVHIRADRDSIYIFPCRGESGGRVSTVP